MINNPWENVCVLANEINTNFLKKYGEYTIIDNDLSFEELKKKLEFFPSKQVVFNETWYNLRENEIRELLNLLKVQNISYINITSNIEEVLYADYIVVYDHELKVMEGLKEDILKEEKTLKRLGYGLPFAVDLSTQLNYYDIFNKIYFDSYELAEDLWN